MTVTTTVSHHDAIKQAGEVIAAAVQDVVVTNPKELTSSNLFSSLSSTFSNPTMGILNVLSGGINPAVVATVMDPSSIIFDPDVVWPSGNTNIPGLNLDTVTTNWVKQNLAVFIVILVGVTLVVIGVVGFQRREVMKQKLEIKEVRKGRY